MWRACRKRTRGVRMNAEIVMKTDTVIGAKNFVKYRTDSLKKEKELLGRRRERLIVERLAQMIFKLCALTAILAVASITLYMILSGTPAIFKVGLKEILFGTVWKPTAAEPQFGILYVILTSVVGTALAVIIGVPVGILTAVFLAEIADKRVAAIVKPAVELPAGIPSVIYGLLGIYLLNPLM